MHPYIARYELSQRHRALTALAGSPRKGRAVSRRVALRPARIPYWRVTWSRLASPSAEPGVRTWMIIVSTRRTIRPTW